MRLHLLLRNDSDSKKKSTINKMSLSSGIPCRIHNCSKCCIDTSMPLTIIDIERIVKQGYRYKDFVIKGKRDRYLKNQTGKCAFLGDNGCDIYSIRPKGCRLYPLVYNEKTNQAIIHDFCPYGYMFKVTTENVENLSSLIKSLEKQV